MGVGTAGVMRYGSPEGEHRRYDFFLFPSFQAKGNKKKMKISKEELDRRWEEMVESNERRWGVVSKEDGEVRVEKGGWRKEMISDLKLLVILLVFWILFFVCVEFV